MKWLSLILLFLFVSVSAQDEEEWRVIPSVTEWLEEINNLVGQYLSAKLSAGSI